MKSSGGGPLRYLLVLGLLSGGLGGCATSAPQTKFTAFSTQRGVVRWQQGPQAISGEADFFRSAQGAVLMQWNDSTGASALRILLTPESRLAVSGTLADRSWSGSVGDAPRSLSTWTSFLMAYQHATKLEPGFREIHSPASRMAYEKSSRGLISLSVASTETRESVSVAFRPSFTIKNPPDGSPPPQNGAAL